MHESQPRIGIWTRAKEAFHRRKTREIEPDGMWLTGAAVVMVHAQTGNIWVHEDLQDNIRTGRKKGLLSIPFETRKENETHRENVLGALVEVFDDFDRQGRPVIPQLARSLFTVDEDMMSTNPVLFSEGMNDYTFNVAVLIYDGDLFDIEPLDNKEAGSGQWMSPEIFLALEGVRPAARQVIEYMTQKHKIIQSKRGEYHFYSHKKKPVIDPDFSFRQSYEERELKSDLKSVPIWSM